MNTPLAQTSDPSTSRPAATVVVAREGADGFEVLLLERSTVGAFAGMWVFPGGRVDESDAGHDELSRARSAAVREALEEVSLQVDPTTLTTLSHWTPPAIAPKRFTTWFFVAPWAGDHPVIDDHEIVAARWISPHAAIAEALPMAPPTHVTLETLSIAGSFGELDRLIESRGIERFVTVPARLDGAMVLLWEGDAGYDTADASLTGVRHRMTIHDGQATIYERSFD